MKRIPVFVFAMSTYADAVLDGLRDVPMARVIGMCGRRPRMSIKEKVARLLELDRVRTTRPVKHWSRGIPFFDVSRMDRVERLLISIKPSVILCCGFPKLIPQRILNAAQHAINLHPGLLPERPGGTPVRWAVKLADPTYGVTAHYMTDKFDAGDIIDRIELPLDKNLTTGEAEAALARHIARMAAAIIRHVGSGAGEFGRTPQTPTKVMKSLRGKYINWRQDGSEDIRRTCLAMRPKTGAMSLYGIDDTVVLWDVEPARNLSPYSWPGTVCNVDQDGPRIVTNDGAIVVHEVLIGGKVRSGLDLNLTIGSHLG